MNKRDCKTWSDIENEYVELLKHNIVAMDDYINPDTVRKNMDKKWRILKVMDELEKNSFVKMWTEGWCTDCEFDSSKCAEQCECQAFKTLKQQWSGDEDEGGDSNEETV